MWQGDQLAVNTIQFFSYYLHKNSLVQGEIQSVVLDHQESNSNNKLMKTI